jgi:hypothetical protein
MSQALRRTLSIERHQAGSTMLKPLLVVAAFAQTAHAKCASDARAIVDDLRPLLALRMEVTIDLPPGSAPPMLEADGQPLAAGPTVMLSTERIVVAGLPQSGANLRARLGGAVDVLTTLRHNFEFLHPHEPFARTLLLSIAPDASWSDVVAALEAFEMARYDRIQIVTWRRRSPPIRRPPPSAADAVFNGLHKMTADQRATILAAQLDKWGSACPPIMTLTAGLSGMDPELKAGAFVDGLQGALEKCSCNVDLASLRTTVFWILTPRDLERQPVQTTVRLAREPGAPTIARPAKSTWGSVGKDVLEALRNQKGMVRVAGQ